MSKNLTFYITTPKRRNVLDAEERRLQDSMIGGN
jgi:hypothetical protein